MKNSEMSRLAIAGGDPALNEALAPYNSIGREEIQAVTEVMETGTLSGFLGTWNDQFLGGTLVRQFETAWSRRFRCGFAVSFNSATSALFAAIGAIGIGPGDEVIVPPYTMSATAMAPLIYGGIPVFADIEAQTFCIDPESVRANLSNRTKAIIAVNLFGHPARLHELRSIADQHGIKLIEDNAQSPLASENGQPSGTIGHLGIFSLNYHKHIHTGEGGICVTDDENLVLRLQMIRNHGENVVEAAQLSDITNIIGFNYRMTEITAAIGIEQLKKVDHHVGVRENIAKRLTEGVLGLEGLTPPLVREGCRHVYYVWSLLYDETAMGVPRELFVDALKAEGLPLRCGYVTPLYLLPAFQKRIAIGANGFPFTLTTRTYEAGLCPVAEELQNKSLICFVICSYDMTDAQADRFVEGIRKVHSAREVLKYNLGDYASSAVADQAQEESQLRDRA
jgi:perosamine synthetase